MDLSCCSLEKLPSQLFYSQDLTHLNLKHNYLTGLTHLTRYVPLQAVGRGGRMEWREWGERRRKGKELRDMG